MVTVFLTPKAKLLNADRLERGHFSLITSQGTFGKLRGHDYNVLDAGWLSMHLVGFRFKHILKKKFTNVLLLSLI